MSPQCQRVLRMLERNRNGVTTRDFMLADGISHKFTTRISDLQRRHGCVIESRRISRTTWRYKLISGPKYSPGTSDSAASGDSSRVHPPSRDDDHAAARPQPPAVSGRTIAAESEASGALFDLDDARPKNAALEDHDEADAA